MKGVRPMVSYPRCERMFIIVFQGVLRLVLQDTDRFITAARRGYLAEHERLMRFYVFINDAAVIAEQYATGPPTGLGANPVGSPAPPFDRRIRPGKGAFNELRSHASIIFQVYLSRGYDNYLLYISDLLAEIFVHRPETLRTSEQVRIEDVLIHHSMQSFIKTLAEKRVYNLVNDGIRKLAEYVSKRMGFPLFDSDEKLSEMIEIGAVRNVIAHNRGVVDQRFTERVPNRKWRVGQPVPLTEEYVQDAMNTMNASVADIDFRVIEKFGLHADSDHS